jgi:hypothetical protein
MVLVSVSVPSGGVVKALWRVFPYLCPGEVGSQRGLQHTTGLLDAFTDGLGGQVELRGNITVG